MSIEGIALSDGEEITLVAKTDGHKFARVDSLKLMRTDFALDPQDDVVTGTKDDSEISGNVLDNDNGLNPTVAFVSTGALGVAVAVAVTTDGGLLCTLTVNAMEVIP